MDEKELGAERDDFGDAEERRADDMRYERRYGSTESES